MNIETHFLVDDVVGRVQQAIRAHDQPAITVIEADHELVLVDSTYIFGRSGADAYERRVAAEAHRVAANRLALAVPQIMITYDDDTVRFRSPLAGPVHDGEEREAIVWMAYDVEDGVEVEHGVIPYTRRSGAPVFTDPDEMVSIPLHPAPGLPGNTLLRHLLDEDLRPRRP
ncbi:MULTISPECIES: hypothetical protein [Protofrankia]|uniref:SnoaL-like domain-containing protein n=1 Tax=Protofrankia coriariae TaxID=1562887 RepID=A0ABR5EZJ2_9ACTN|nr:MULTISPECIES: hypothetical protein [Protofrankia]KLL09871.1 hypothetical protein FrCorBMG51_21795 [Protofrankia coriariae]ONH34192.1 hypothetical protein BL254_17515 [Protofrankia sp. BMG5.30]